MDILSCKKKTKEKQTVSFSYDNLDIVGVFGSDVFVRGDIMRDTQEECLLIIDRELFHATVDMWMDAKKDYCERWNEFCGQMGRLYSKDYKEFPKSKRITLRVDDEVIPVRTFKIISFDECVDMEHG